MNLPLLRRLTPLFECLGRPRTLVALFLLCALPTGLGCAMLSPLGAPPDEMAALARVDGLRLGQVLNAPPPPPSGSPGVLIDSGVSDLILSMDGLIFSGYDTNGNVPPSLLARAAAIHWSGTNTFCMTQMVMYSPVFYAPATLGLWAGKAAGMGPFHAAYLARVLMLLTYIAMGAAALRLARFGGGLLFVALTLPTSIFLGASCNQDGQLIAACALAAALLTRVKPAAWWGALALLTAITLGKISYGLLMLFCLAPLRGPGIARRAGAVALAALLPGLWLLHIHNLGFAPWPWPPYHPGPLWPGDRTVWLHDARPENNVRVLLAHPAQILLLPLHSLAAHWHDTWRRILACVSVDFVLLRPWEYPCLVAALGFAAMAPAAPGRHWLAADAGLGLLILFGSFMGVELSLYLTYTPAGEALVAGVQGRYFLLLLPFCIFPLSWIMARLPWRGLPAGLFCLPGVALALVNILALPLFLFQLFRMAGP